MKSRTPRASVRPRDSDIPRPWLYVGGYPKANSQAVADLTFMLYGIKNAAAKHLLEKVEGFISLRFYEENAFLHVRLPAGTKIPSWQKKHLGKLSDFFTYVLLIYVSYLWIPHYTEKSERTKNARSYSVDCRDGSVCRTESLAAASAAKFS